MISRTDSERPASIITSSTAACNGLMSAPGSFAKGHGPQRYAPAETLTKLSWIEEIVNDLLDPAGRDRRRRAVQSLNGGKAGGALSAAIPATKPAYRRGWLVATVTSVLKAAREPMQARAIHRAAEELAGEPVSWSSVRNCLASGSSGKTPRFERLGYGRYRAVPNANSR
jgi:hypothetical protein